MKHVTLIFVTLFIFLVSFVDKDNIFTGYGVGDKAPDFTLPSMIEVYTPLSLRSFQGEYVLLSFWAAYDARSRERNVQLNRAVAQMEKPIKMVSISFDEYRSVFCETIQRDQLNPSICWVDVHGQNSPIYKRYRLNRGFKNFLLDPQGEIIAKNVDAEELASLTSGR